jgi:hypothetical protein
MVAPPGPLSRKSEEAIEDALHFRGSARAPSVKRPMLTRIGPSGACAIGCYNSSGRSGGCALVYGQPNGRR